MSRRPAKGTHRRGRKRYRERRKFAYDYGGEHYHAAVLGHGCAVAHADGARCWSELDAHHWRGKRSPTSRGWRDSLCLCRLHHTEVHQLGRERFEARYGVDLIVIAARNVADHGEVAVDAVAQLEVE